MRIASFGSSLALAVCLALLPNHAARSAPAASHLHHEIAVRLEPAAHRIEGSDTLTVPAARRVVPLRFQVHAGLEVTSADAAWIVRAVETEERTIAADAEEEALEVPVTTYEARPADGSATWPGDAPLTLQLVGLIDHPVVSGAEEYARSFAQTPGTISAEGVMLSGSTAWLR